MHAPQIIVITLFSLSAIVHLANDGKLREPRKWDFTEDAANSVIWLGILFWGGFFSH